MFRTTRRKFIHQTGYAAGAALFGGMPPWPDGIAALSPLGTEIFGSGQRHAGEDRDS